MTVRGFYGEGTMASGDLYQISNQVTLGRTETQLIDDLRALGFANPLKQHLASRLRGDAAELFLLRRVVTLVDPVAVLVDVVGDERELHRLGIDLHDDLVGGIGAALVGRGESVDEYVQQRVARGGADGLVF